MSYLKVFIAVDSPGCSSIQRSIYILSLWLLQATNGTPHILARYLLNAQLSSLRKSTSSIFFTVNRQRLAEKFKVLLIAEVMFSHQRRKRYECLLTPFLVPVNCKHGIIVYVIIRPTVQHHAKLFWDLIFLSLAQRAVYMTVCIYAMIWKRWG